MIAESDYSKYSMPALRVDSHFTVIEATLKGYTKWKVAHPNEQNIQALEDHLLTWCHKLLEMNFEVGILDIEA